MCKQCSVCGHTLTIIGCEEGKCDSCGKHLLPKCGVETGFKYKCLRCEWNKTMWLNHPLRFIPSWDLQATPKFQGKAIEPPAPIRSFDAAGFGMK